MSTRLEKSHSVDPQTGMLNPTGNFPNVFDPDRKKAFLTLYKQNGLRLRRACRSMGMSESTISHHLKIDPQFRHEFDAIEKDYLEELECTSKENGLNPKSVIERIFLLKCLLPSKYGQENKPVMQNIVVNIDQNMIEQNRKRVETIDAEVVTELEQSRKQIHQSVDSQQYAV